MANGIDILRDVKPDTLQGTEAVEGLNRDFDTQLTELEDRKNEYYTAVRGRIDEIHSLLRAENVENEQQLRATLQSLVSLRVLLEQKGAILTPGARLKTAAYEGTVGTVQGGKELVTGAFSQADDVYRKFTTDWKEKGFSTLGSFAAAAALPSVIAYMGIKHFPKMNWAPNWLKKSAKFIGSAALVLLGVRWASANFLDTKDGSSAPVASAEQPAATTTEAARSTEPAAASAPASTSEASEAISERTAA